MERIQRTNEKSRRPPGDAFRQQRMATWQPVITPFKIIVAFIAVGILFIPTGTSIYKSSNVIFEQRVVYDGSKPQDVQCQISTANEGRRCIVPFVFDQDVTGPVLIYYELNRFYQNHRKYVNSYSSMQLQGANIGAADQALATACNPLSKNGTMSLNPCGLVANSLFTDIISLSSSSVIGAVMDETNIAMSSEKGKKFKQVDGFQYKIVADATVQCADVALPVGCKYYKDKTSGISYLFFYPSDDTVQYLYETYPQQISPILGVTDEHFIVWMRTAALPRFRKLYGRIHQNFVKGDTIELEVEANFEVRSFNGDKAIVISTVSQFGGRNPSLGIAYLVAGCLSITLGFVFAVKQWLSPRSLGDPKLLHWEVYGTI